MYVGVSVSPAAIEISITDEGIGISKSNVEKVFDRFFRAEEISPVISGLGIGLHIANEIIKRHQGSIRVKSEINKGSVFTVVLPFG